MLSVRKKTVGIGFIILTVLCLNLGITAHGYAQDRMETTSYAEKSHKKIVAVKDNMKYSFEFTRNTLKKALEALASKANLTLSYHSDLLQGSTIVNTVGENLSVRDAKSRVLNNTGLDYKITQAHHLVIFKKENVSHLRGVIVGDTTGKPSMQGARVYLLKAKTSMLPEAKLNFGQRTFVNAKGEYEINNVKPGVYRLFIIQDGIKEIYKKVIIRKGKTIVDYHRLKYPSLK